MQNSHNNRRLVDPYLQIGPEAPSSDSQQNISPTPGQQALVLAALLIGILLMGIQLWLLSVALELYLAGGEHNIWALPLISGLIFSGGLLTLRILNRSHPRRS